MKAADVTPKILGQACRVRNHVYEKRRIDYPYDLKIVEIHPTHPWVRVSPPANCADGWLRGSEVQLKPKVLKKEPTELKFKYTPYYHEDFDKIIIVCTAGFCTFIDAGDGQSWPFAESYLWLLKNQTRLIQIGDSWTELGWDCTQPKNKPVFRGGSKKRC